MKILLKSSIVVVLSLVFLWGCTKDKQRKFPETTPDKVVMQFFELLSTGGKLSTREALQMVSNKYGALNTDTFRRWTQDFNAESKIKIVNVKLPDKPNKNGDYVAVVKMEIHTPSMFGGSFTTHSQINMLLDDKDNKWKIDFLAHTIDEEDFLKAPAEARLK